MLNEGTVRYSLELILHSFSAQIFKDMSVDPRFHTPSMNSLPLTVIAISMDSKTCVELGSDLNGSQSKQPML